MGKRPVRTTLSVKNLMYRGVPREYIHADLDEYPIEENIRELFARYMDYLDEMFEDKINLILYGSNGSGKTYLSSLIVKEAYRKRYTSFRITLKSFIDMHFKRDKDELIAEKLSEIINSEFLVIDEVGKETFDKSQFNIAVFEELLRERDTQGKPTIICTNLPLEERGGLYEQYGKSIQSLIDGNFLKVKFEGEDNRHDVTRKKRGIQLLLGEL